jgi:hypothetical protein
VTTKERYFVINRWYSKGGKLKSKITEFETHEKATCVAYDYVRWLLEDSGECVEEFIVFVGSKTQCDKLYHD